MTSDHGQPAADLRLHRHRHRQGCLPHRRLRRRGQGRPAQEVQALSAGERARQAAAEHRRARGLPQRPLRQPHAAPARAHATHHPGDLRQAVHQGPEERLQRCRGHRRGGAASQPARRAGEDAGSARSAGAASRARPAGVAPHGDDQPDPRLSHRAWDRRAHRRQRSAPIAVRHSGEPRGRAVAAHDATSSSGSTRTGCGSTSASRRSPARSRRSVTVRRTASA